MGPVQIKAESSHFPSYICLSFALPLSACCWCFSTLSWSFCSKYISFQEGRELQVWMRAVSMNSLLQLLLLSFPWKSARWLALSNLFCHFNRILVKSGKWNEVQCFGWWLAPKGAAQPNEELACCGARYLRLQDGDLLLKSISWSELNAKLRAVSGRLLTGCWLKVSPNLHA